MASDKKLIPYELEEGVIIYVEVDSHLAKLDRQSGGQGDLEMVTRGGDDLVKKASTTLSNSLDAIKPLVQQVKSKIDAIGKTMRPDEVEFSVGLKFAGKFGVVISSLETDANLSLKFKWKTGPE